MSNKILGSHMVTVIPLPALFTVTGGGPLCAGETGVGVGLTGSETGVSYQLLRNGSPTGNPVAGTGSALSFGGQTQGGTYTVQATGPASTSCQHTMSGSVTVTVSVNSLPTVTLTATPSTTLTCANPIVTLAASTTATILRWSDDGSTVPSRPISQSGTYSVIVTDGIGCTAVSNSVSISENKISPLVSASATGSVLTCAVPAVTLTATSSATALRWSTNATTGSIPVSQTGTYSVTATGANGCTAVSNAVTIGIDLSLPPFTVRSATACQGQTISLLAEGCPGQVVWSGGTTGVSIQLTAGVSGSALTATCTVGSCSTTASGSVVVGGLLPPPAQILSLRSEESGCPVQLIGQGVGSSFVMTNAQGYVFSTVYRQGGTHDAFGLNVTQAGVYTLTATYTNECGVSAPVSRSVTVGRSCP